MEKEILEIVEFTDPVCTWCWGSEPVLRALETRYGNQLKISYIMGGLVKDITTFNDQYNEIGGDPDLSNKNIAIHWLEASERHGMPVKVEGFKLFSKEHPSTYPQNIAYKAAQMQDDIKANLFLRRIREASATEARQTNLTDVLIELASEVGLDISRFLGDFTSGAARDAFEDDLYTTSQFRAHGFPTFLIKYGEKSTLLRGYQNYSNIRTIINYVSNGAIQEVKLLSTEENIFEFIKRYRSPAPVEIKMAFELTDDEFEKIQNSLLHKQLIKKREAGNGYFLSAGNNPFTCNTETGVCM